MNSLAIRIKEKETLSDFQEGSVNNFSQVWNKVAFSLGIRKPLTEPELQIILEFMREYHKALTLQDVSKAFGLYSAAELDFQESHFQSMDNVFIGKVLKSYKEWKRKEAAKPKPIEPSKQLEQPKEDFQKHFDYVKRCYQKDGVLPIANWKGLFKWMEIKGMINLSNKEKNTILAEVKQEVENQIKHRKAMIQDFSDLLMDLEDDKIKQLARKEAVRRFFKSDSC